VPTTIDPFRSATALAAAIGHRELSPVEVADVYLDRVDDLDGELNAFCFRGDDDVRAAAAAAADRVVHASSPDDLPPFLGVPLPIKDLLDVAGWPTTHGSAGAHPGPVARSSPVVRRFVDAGFVPFGKTTTSEFGTVPFTESEVLGTSRNPWDPECTPGGSSSGAGVSVAAGMAPIAHAADGGGSIRIPASCTGLVGHKPTRGLVTNGPIASEGFAAEGVVARTVQDAAAALDVLARHDPGAWWSPPTPERSFQAALRDRPPTGLRVGVLVDAPIDGVPVDPACRDAVAATVQALADAGHRIEDASLPLPPTDDVLAAFTPVWNLAGVDVDLADPDAIEPLARALRAEATATDSWAYARAVLASQDVSRRIVEAFTERFDLLVTPTMACLPPAVGFWRDGADEDPMAPLRHSYPMAVFTSLFNVTGQPAVSVPTHHDAASGLPVGVQLVAAPWQDTRLLRVAQTLEAALPWAGRRPDLCRR